MCSSDLGDVQKVKNLLTEASEKEMTSMVAEYKNGKVKINNTELDSTLFTLATKPKQEYVVASEGDITVVLDTTLDRDLMLEGMSRELIRSAQVLRKLGGFNVDDRIDIEFVTDSADLNEIVIKFANKIKSELLARDIKPLTNPEVNEVTEIGDEKITIKMKR